MMKSDNKITPLDVINQVFNKKIDGGQNYGTKRIRRRATKNKRTKQKS